MIQANQAYGRGQEPSYLNKFSQSSELAKKAAVYLFVTLAKACKFGVK